MSGHLVGGCGAEDVRAEAVAADAGRSFDGDGMPWRHWPMAIDPLTDGLGGDSEGSRQLPLAAIGPRYRF